MPMIFRPRFTIGSFVSGGVGGAVAAGIAIAILTVVHTARGGSTLVPLNAIGAWLVRWLQQAGPDAFTHFYADATLSGVAIAVVVGGTVGALFASLLDRLPQDHPVGWGLMAGLVLWVVTWWRVLPALDPAFVAHLEREAWLVACLTYGGLLGAWVHGDRWARHEEVAGLAIG